MKTKKNFGIKITIAIISLIVLVLVCLSPNLIGRLIGSVNSVDTNSTEPVNTGVVLNLNKTYSYSDNNPLVMKVYNGSNTEITINGIISRSYCTSSSCDAFTVTNLDTPITINPNEEKEYTITSTDSLTRTGLIEAGVQYSMKTMENETEVTKTYNIASTSIEIPGDIPGDLNSTNSNTTENDSKEFTFTGADESGKDNIYVKISDANIHMDKSEKLEDLNVYYSIRSSFGNKWEYEHPQNENSTTNKLMFNEQNKSNIKSYFSYVSPSKSIKGTGSFEYGNQFKLVGAPNNMYSNVDVVLGFYFRQYKDSIFGVGGYEYWSDEATPFSSSEIPHFTLTVYDKSNLKTAIANGVEKIEKSDEEVENDSWLNYVNIINTAVNLYQSRDKYVYYSSVDDAFTSNGISKEVTQSEIDNMVDLLNNTSITPKAEADYTKYNELISLIQSKKEEWYTPDSYAEFKTVYDKRSNYENLSSAYQLKVDNYVNELQSAFDKLVMYDADYTLVDVAIKSAELVVNKTEDGKYDLYTEESWNRLQEAINSVDRSLKIENQDVVDGYAKAISDAHASLEIAPANYGELNALISSYKDSEAYKNNWYTDETKMPVDEYLENVSDDKLITEQDVVDKWVEELEPLIDALKLKKALGYLDSDNYVPFEGALSIEGYMNIIKNLDKSLYTDEGVEIIDMMIEMYEAGTDEMFNLTIDRQDEMDEFLRSFDVLIKYQLDTIKLPGDYTELCELYEKALLINQDYYEDVSELRQALWDINWDYKIDEQDEIDASVQRLQEAMDNLVMKDADYTDFNEAYEKLSNLNSAYYVDFSDAQAALLQAEDAMNLKIDEQQKVDDATNALNDAYSKLVLKDADYSQINTLKAVIAGLDKNKYTNFETVEEALNNVVYGKKADEQDVVDEMYRKLKNAYDNLQKTKADYSKLNEAVANAKRYESNKDNYTNYSDLEKLINEINYNLTWEDQDEVDALASRINEAINNLNKKPADYSALANILSKIPSDYSKYDNTLKNEINTYLDLVKKLSKNLKYDEQSLIDELVVKGNALLQKISNANVEDGNVINNDQPSINTDVILSYLEVNGTRVDISKSPFKSTVAYNVSEAKISVGLASNDSTSRVYGGKVLVPGDNNVTIIITTKDNKTYTYSLVITRLTSSNYLSDLKVKGSNIEFNKNKEEYNVKVDKNTDKLDLSTITEDENAKVTIKGNENLKNGSKVTIEVESEDGSVRVYTLNVQKPGSVDARIIIVLIMILAVIAGIFRYIQERRRINKENNV